MTGLDPRAATARLNIGYIELGGGTDPNGGTFDVKVYYDTTWLGTDPTRDPNLAPLINGPRGYCLDLTNTLGRTETVIVNGLKNRPVTYTVGQGSPVVQAGQPKSVTGWSLTVAQMNAAGFTTRGDLGEIDLQL